VVQSFVIDVKLSHLVISKVKIVTIKEKNVTVLTLMKEYLKAPKVSKVSSKVFIFHLWLHLWTSEVNSCFLKAVLHYCFLEQKPC